MHYLISTWNKFYQSIVKPSLNWAIKKSSIIPAGILFKVWLLRLMLIRRAVSIAVPPVLPSAPESTPFLILKGKEQEIDMTSLLFFPLTA